ncbi:MAG TPA: YceI family protein [Bryobacteraceae bacterium]|nr:YceI family protein [Bryobacteraceae bacterium]
MAAIPYQIDTAHTHAQFKVRHMMISNVRGEFSKVTGSVVFDPDNPAATRIDAEMDVSTLTTREPQRDEHLKSGDFFDAARHPTITFASTEVVASGSDSFEVTGDLTIRGNTRKVALSVEDVTPETKDPWGNLRRGATAKTHINRKDFGLEWNVALEAGGFLVGDEVDITIDVEMIRQAA